MENSVEVKLKQLYKVQAIDSKIDKIHAIRGELPMEVSDLEDEIEGLGTRVEKLKAEIESLNEDIDAKKQSMKDSDSLIKKYDAQLGDVKNNREYLALTKEIELQNLEKMASEKKINEFKHQIEAKKESIESSKHLAEERKKDLEVKKGELDNITGETQKEEEGLLKLRNEIMSNIEARLAKAYDKIRSSYSNKLAVVPIERESCGGCFSLIPPQRQLDIANRKKIIVCEHCGRVLVDYDLSEAVRADVGQAVSA
jgi:predicted  nucleic acid-binding Zn-ribbon protein